MASDKLTITRTGALAEIHLHAAPAADRRLLDDLDAACAAIHDDVSTHVVLVTGDRDAFALRYDPRDLTHVTLPFRALETMAQPVVVAMDGAARDAGLELALACDVRIASNDATFAFTMIDDGLVPSLGGTQRLPRVAGRAVATRMLLLGETLDAETARRCGLVNRVAPSDDAASIARAIADSIASRGPLAVRYAKEAILRGLDMPLDQALRYETDLTVILQTTDDRAEGVRAFLEKRPPRFEGK